jgi:DMSO/TMAO reductase YedYZ molybdopterin-dependent catalytic subunit
MMLFLLQRWRWLAGAAVLALALLFVHAYGQTQYKAGQAQVQATWDAARLAANKALIKKEREDVERYQQAIAQRETALAAARTAAGKSAAAAASLRQQLDTARGRLAKADAATCADYATTSNAVFSECVAKYRSVAEAADGHAADATALMHAWSK